MISVQIATGGGRFPGRFLERTLSLLSYVLRKLTPTEHSGTCLDLQCYQWLIISPGGVGLYKKRNANDKLKAHRGQFLKSISLN